MAPKKRKGSKLHEARKKIDFKTSVSFNEYEKDYHISLPYFNTALTFKPQEIKQKLMIAANITLECKEIKNNLLAGKSIEGKFEPTVKRLHDFTNLPSVELKEIFDKVLTRDRSFQKTLKDIRTFPEATVGLLADDIRSILTKYILEEKRFPSKTDLLKDLKALAGKYCNENIPIQRLVRNKLIKYQHFPEFNKYLLTEHPEKNYQRTVYLNQVKEFRAQQRNFIYVEVRRIVPRGTASGFIAGLAAIPSCDKLEKFFTKDSTDPIAKKWLQQRILPIVPENSVVILAQPKARSKVSASGKRLDYISWLDQNGIPYRTNSHTAELHNLIATFKSKVKKEGLYDHVFLNAGFALIHFPDEWRSLNFFKSIWADINVMDTYHPGRPESLKQKILNATAMVSNLNEAEESLIEAESKVMKEDSAMEDIIENVQEMAKRGEIQSSDFPNECSGDKTDYFETHISDVILDMVYE